MVAWQIRRINATRRDMIDDRIIGPYFTTIAAWNSHCFIFIGQIRNFCRPETEGRRRSTRYVGENGCFIQTVLLMRRKTSRRRFNRKSRSVLALVSFLFFFFVGRLLSGFVAWFNLNENRGWERCLRIRCCREKNSSGGTSRNIVEIIITRYVQWYEEWGGWVEADRLGVVLDRKNSVGRCHSSNSTEDSFVNRCKTLIY